MAVIPAHTGDTTITSSDSNMLDTDLHGFYSGHMDISNLTAAQVLTVSVYTRFSEGGTWTLVRRHLVQGPADSDDPTWRMAGIEAGFGLQVRAKVSGGDLSARRIFFRSDV